MKVSGATVSSGRTRHPHRATAPRPCGKASLNGTAASSILQDEPPLPGMLPTRGKWLLLLSVGSHWVFMQLWTGPCWIPQRLQCFGHAHLSRLPLNINPSFMAKRGPLDVHILWTLVGCSIVVLHSRAHAEETSLPVS